MLQRFVFNIYTFRKSIYQPSPKIKSMKQAVVFLFAALCIACCNELTAQSTGSLLVVNKADNTVSLVDLSTNKEIVALKTGNGPHEVATSFDGKTAVVCNYGDKAPNNSLSVIDITAKTVTRVIDLGTYTRPHGIEFINNKETLVTSEATQTLIKVNIETGIVEEVVKTGQPGSHMVAYCRKDGKAYVANIPAGTVSQVDVKEKKLLNTIQLKKGVEGLDISPDGKELWVANRDDSSVTAINTTTLEKLAVLPAHQVAFRVKFLADGSHVVVSNGMSGNLSVYNVKERKWIKDINFFDLDLGIDKIGTVNSAENPPIPVGIATHANSKFVYVANANYGLVAVVDTKTWTVVKSIKVGKGPDGLYYSSASLG
jgi:YVTN family beta-propeller protein